MACFIVPLVQAVTTTVVRHYAAQSAPSHVVVSQYLSHLPRLEAMLYGGSAMLIVDHILSGEILPLFPFFSALADEGGLSTMLREILTVGVPMSLIVTLIWALPILIRSRQNAH